MSDSVQGEDNSEALKVELSAWLGKESGKKIGPEDIEELRRDPLAALKRLFDSDEGLAHVALAEYQRNWSGRVTDLIGAQSDETINAGHVEALPQHVVQAAVDPLTTATFVTRIFRIIQSHVQGSGTFAFRQTTAQSFQDNRQEARELLERGDPTVKHVAAVALAIEQWRVPANMQRVLAMYTKAALERPNRMLDPATSSLNAAPNRIAQKVIANAVGPLLPTITKLSRDTTLQSTDAVQIFLAMEEQIRYLLYGPHSSNFPIPEEVLQCILHVIIREFASQNAHARECVSQASKLFNRVQISNRSPQDSHDYRAYQAACVLKDVLWKVEDESFAFDLVSGIPEESPQTPLGKPLLPSAYTYAWKEEFSHLLCSRESADVVMLCRSLVVPSNEISARFGGQDRSSGRGICLEKGKAYWPNISALCRDLETPATEERSRAMQRKVRAAEGRIGETLRILCPELLSHPEAAGQCAFVEEGDHLSIFFPADCRPESIPSDAVDVAPEHVVSLLAPFRLTGTTEWKGVRLRTPAALERDLLSADDVDSEFRSTQAGPAPAAAPSTTAARTPGGSAEHAPVPRLQAVRNVLLRNRWEAVFSWDPGGSTTTEQGRDFTAVQRGHYVVVTVRHDGENRAQIVLNDDPDVAAFLVAPPRPIGDFKGQVNSRNLRAAFDGHLIDWNAPSQFEAAVESALDRFVTMPWTLYGTNLQGADNPFEDLSDPQLLQFLRTNVEEVAARAGKDAHPWTVTVTDVRNCQSGALLWVLGTGCGDTFLSRLAGNIRNRIEAQIGIGLTPHRQQTAALQVVLDALYPAQRTTVRRPRPQNGQPPPAPPPVAGGTVQP